VTVVRELRENFSVLHRGRKIHVENGIFLAPFETFLVGATSSPSPKPSATLQNSYTNAQMKKNFSAESLWTLLLPLVYLLHVDKLMSLEHFVRFATSHMFPKKVLGQCYKALEQAFNLAPGASSHHTASSPSTGPENLLVRYCNHLDLPPNVQAICSDIIIAARKYGIADGRSPVSIAGGAIYFTCHLLGKVKSVRDISAVAGVSEGTIKLVYRLYYTAKEKLVKQEWIDEGKVNIDRLPLDSNK